MAADELGVAYQDALDAVHTHCNQCTNCRQARRDGTWPTVACSTGKRLRKTAAAAWQPRKDEYKAARAALMAA